MKVANVRAWSTVLRATSQQQNPANAQPQMVCEAQLGAPVVWRIAVKSTQPPSPVIAQLTAVAYGAGGASAPFPIADGDEVAAHGITIFAPPFAVTGNEQVYVAVAPIVWPDFLQVGS